MSNLAKKAIGGSIHKIREFELEKVNLAEEFDILQIVGEGWFGKILLVEHKATDTEMVLKALPKPYSALRDFYREFHYSLHLGAHRNIITTYDVAFETAGFYVFSQEYAPLGDLTSNVSDTGIGELHSKRVAKQLAAALEHLHVRDLVHRDVKLDNILVFKSDFSRIKLCDFGETRKAGTLVRRQNEWLPYAPPEVLLISNDDTYKTETIHDVWQFGIVIFVCLTGCLPWQKAGVGDPRYARYLSWHTSTLNLRHRQPKLFRLVSSRAQRLFRKFLEPKPEKRPATLSDVHKYLDERWMAKNNSDKNAGIAEVDDGLCPSMYSFHSSPEEKNKLLHSLTQYGIETTVDRSAKKDRIRAWIENSIITEEEEDANGQEIDTDEEERVGILDNETGPPGERMNRGPIQTKSTKIDGKTTDDKQKRREILNAMINKRNSAIYIPPVDPRIPLEQQRRARSEVQLKNIVQQHPVEYFHKFASQIAQDLPQEKKSTPIQKTQMATQTSLSNESNNSIANSDDSTKVNFQNKPIPEDRKQSPPKRESTPRGSLKQKNGFNSSLEEDTPTSYYQNNILPEDSRRTPPKKETVASKNSLKQKKATILPKASVYANGYDSSRRTSGGTPQNKYSGKYQMKNRYDIYEMKEEKSSSSISNSTGRSISK